jgi:hypothetical protein
VLWHNKQATNTAGSSNTHASAHASAGAGVSRVLCRYKKAADWTLLSDLVQDNPTLPLIGNGDILTHYEAADRYEAPHKDVRPPWLDNQGGGSSTP